MSNRLIRIKALGTDANDYPRFFGWTQEEVRRYFDVETVLKLPRRFWRRTLLRLVVLHERRYPGNHYNSYHDATRRRVLKLLRRRGLLKLARVKSFGSHVGRNFIDHDARAALDVHTEVYADPPTPRSTKRRREKRPRMKRARR